MDTASAPSRISRFDLRYHHRIRDVSPTGESAPEQEAGEEEERRRADVDEPLLVREQKGRQVMGEAHRRFHRRAAQEASNVLTVNVVVEQTVDNGNVVGLATVTPSLPVVPAVPTDALPSVPTVPALPAFPSDLEVPSVPAYPFSVITATPTEADPEPTTTELTTTEPTATEPTSPLLTTSPEFNSTVSSSVISSTPLSSSLNSTTTSPSSFSSTPSSTPSTPSPRSSSTSSTLASTSSSSLISSVTSYASPTSSAGGGGGGGDVNIQNTVAPESSPTAVADAQSNSDTPLGTPQVVGTVFGSLAGAALLLAVLLFLIRRHKRKQRGALQLTGDGDTDQRQPMAQTATRSSFAPPSFLNRFSGASRSTAESSGTGERSFQRISGRKLPSAFSEGMTSEQFTRDGTLSGSSFYQDDKGFYGSAGVIPKDFGKEIGKEIGETSNTGTVGRDERVMPSPARTPVIHHPDDAPPWGTNRNGAGSALSPPPTPKNPFADPKHTPRGTLGRSHASQDGSRSSRFTENV